MKYIFLFTLAFAQLAQAQFITSVPYSMSTPAGNVQLTQQVYMPTHYSNRNSNPKFDFEVTLKNDSVVKFRSRILSENKKLYIEWKEKKNVRQIFPSETKKIVTETESGIKVGMPADSCWLFFIIDGAINCYSSIPLSDYYNTIAIQKGGAGPIIPLTQESLRAMINVEDKKVQKLIKQGWLADAIRRYNEKKKRS